ncbi:hypothetical protein OAP51_04315 [Alphaproteobacteria bacterium]|jgi:uncharacterized protein YgiM (DUF1202 family)|nr:hypothetical protein [Alphaproteobacteria bacterium]
MRNRGRTLFLIVFIVLGSGSMLASSSSAYAGALSAIIKALLGESDTVAKGAGKSTDNLSPNATKSGEEITGKIEGGSDEYDLSVYSNLTLRGALRAKTTCSNNQWAVTLNEDTYVYSKPDIATKIKGTLVKNEKVCVLKEEDKWVRTLFGWVESDKVQKL